MFRAIGLVIVLWYITSIFIQTTSALDSAGKATFEALEAAAVASKKGLE